MMKRIAILIALLVAGPAWPFPLMQQAAAHYPLQLNSTTVSGNAISVGNLDGTLGANTPSNVTGLVVRANTWYLIGTSNALFCPTTDTSNVCASVGIGAEALDSILVAGNASYHATCVGFRTCGGSGDALTSAAVGNTGIGYQALKNNTSGSANTAIGNNAGGSITSGANTTFVGSGAGNASTGTSTVGVGVNAVENATGNSNLGVGLAAARQVTSGGSNTAVGTNALAGNSGAPGTGSNNTALGATALFAVQGSGQANTGVGQDAGSAITTGSSNTVLGKGVGSSTLSTGNSNILIGTASAVDTPTSSTSNYLNIQNTLIADMAKGIVNFKGTAPATPTSCGTSPAIDANASDVSGTVTEGSAATGCTIAFANTHGATPHCAVSSQAGLAFSYAVSTTAITVTNIGALSSTKIDYICFGGGVTP